ncbi:MAG: tyrosine-type recombinase/integrase [Candidatus Dormibacteria bacterium]
MELALAAQEYLTYLAVDRARSPQTIRAYQKDLQLALRFWAGLRQPPALTEDLTRDAVRAYQRHLGEAGGAVSSRARRLQGLRGFLRHGLREGWIDSDLAAHIDIPRVAPPLPKPLSTTEARRVLRYRTGAGEAALRDAALIHFLISTGCRISEALAVQRSQISDEGRLVVRGKGSKERVVHLTPLATTVIRSYLDSRHDRLPWLFLNYDRSSAARGRRQLTGAGARQVLNRVRRETGIERLRSPHVLRHTTATELLTITGNVRLVQEVLGHANLNTMQGYTKVVDQARVRAYQDLALRLEPESEPANPGSPEPMARHRGS